jgi:hypothetical protein
MDEPRDDTQQDEEQDVEGHGALKDEPALRHTGGSDDDDVEAHALIPQPGLNEPAL